MSVEHISEGMGTHSIHRGYVDAKQKIESQKGEKNVSDNVRSDKAEISDAARRLMNRDSLVQKIREVFERLPEVSEEKIRQVMGRLSVDYYSRREVLEKIGDSLLEENKGLDFSSSAEGPEETYSKVKGDIRIEKIQEVERKIETGFYNRNDILDNIVNRLLGF